ncbi:hypothetical protein F5051DRAFT_14874 [Lentinula edodes]|nr:hypothetical protein F5051DRAFT_14874 [Lentinula edodes]
MHGSLGFNISMVSLSLYMTLAAHRPRTVYRRFLLCLPPSPLARYPPPLSILINHNYPPEGTLPARDQRKCRKYTNDVINKETRRKQIRSPRQCRIPWSYMV